MNRLLRQIISATMAIALAGTLAAAVRVVATTEGTRWLLTSVANLSGVGLSIKKVEGRIIDHLLLTELRVNLAEQKLEINHVELDWKPLLLLAGTIAVQELVISGVRIQDDTLPDNKPPIPAWPKVSETGQLFDGRISRVRVTDISYRRMREEPVHVTSIDGSVIWQGSVLSIDDLKAVSPSGRISGNFSAGFKQASLTADFAITPTHPLADMDRFTIKARHVKGSGPEQLAGNITVEGSIGTRKLLELGGDIGMARDSLNLRQLRLTRPGKKGQLTGEGSIKFTAQEPLLSLQLKADGLDLAPELNFKSDLSGTIGFRGTLESYRGYFSLANRSQGWQAATVSASYQGTSNEMKLNGLKARVLDGSLTGNMEMNWRNGFSMQTLLSGRGLNPARIDPAWKGVANFSVTGKLDWNDTTPLKGSVSGILLESRLHGEALTGELQAEFSGDNLSISRLVLQGKGFNLHASGKLNQRITVAAHISDFSRLLPGSAGMLKGEGWILWRNRQLSGEVTGRGSRLAYAGAKISDINLTARLEQGTGYPVHATASLKDVIYDGYTLNTVTVAADGTLKRHSVSANMSSGSSEVRVSLNGGYNDGVWKGEINRLAGRDNIGLWNMTAPVTFSFSAGNFSIASLALAAGSAERIELSADLALKPLRGPVRAKWYGINLGRLKPWLPQETRVEGRISGEAKGILHPGNRFELDGSALLSSGTLHQKRIDGEQNLAFKSATASWGWRGEALSGNLSLIMTQYGQARGTFQLPLAAHFPLSFDPKGSLRGSLIGKAQEKGIITALFPGLVQESSGELDAELEISGTWEVPQVGGKLRLSKAGAYLPTAGIHLKDVELAARLERNLIRIDSFRALSGPGQIEGTALITLNGWQVASYKGTINGDKFQTVYFPELQILSTPKLSFEGTPHQLKLRGELHLPELVIVGSQSHTTVTPSSDVIREGVEVPVTKTSPVALDVQVRVLLGDKVFVKVAGIDASLGGAIDLSFISLDRISSKGEIKVVKGRYRTYGVNLEIVRGRLFFAGGSIDRPTLDFLALRTIGDVRAGVTVVGTLRRPITRLYSEPAMPDVDILSYMVLGHPLDSGGAQASLVAQAAGALLSTGQANVLQDQIKNQLGLSTLEIQGGVGGTTKAMGYKALQVTPPGEVPTTQLPGITETVLTVGKYLTPELYISYGKSLFTGSNLFRLRYDIFKQWQIETQNGGGESGADLYYKLEFK
jgi:autotransporter translocation and assembly factor TamB